MPLTNEPIANHPSYNGRIIKMKPIRRNKRFPHDVNDEMKTNITRVFQNEKPQLISVDHRFDG